MTFSILMQSFLLIAIIMALYRMFAESFVRNSAKMFIPRHNLSYRRWMNTGTMKKEILCTCEDDMLSLGYDIADLCDDSEVILLTGDLGAGKTTLSRGIIRRKLLDDSFRVTSPSYLLENAYQFGEKSCVRHIDLYRLPQSADLKIIGIPDIFFTSICLIEWPQRMTQPINRDYLEIDIKVVNTDERVVTLIPKGLSWVKKLQDVDEVPVSDNESNL